MDTYKKITLYIQEKIAHPGVQKHSKNMGWMFFAKIGSMVITFLATAYIARNLGPTNYGQLSYAISFVSLFSFIASLGIDQILYRDLIKEPEKRNELLGSAIGLRAIASIMAVIAIAVTTLLISDKDVSIFLIFIISLSPLLGSFQLLSYEFQSEVKSKHTSILVLLVVLTLNILKIVTILLNGGVIYLAFIVLLEPLFYSVGYIYLKEKIYGDIGKLKLSKTTAISILKDSYPLIFASAFYLIYARIDQVMLKHMINSEAVGLYDAAVRISEVSYFVPQILIVSLLPAIINAKKTSSELYYARTKKLILTLLSTSFILAFITTILSKNLILIIFGAGFLGAIPILHIYVWSNIGASLNSMTQQILITENLTRFVSITTFFGMIINVTLNIILIPKYGVSGAAFATLISYMIPFLSMLLFTKTRLILKNIFNA
ncbi:flippase [Candidatus Gracilibacteria bacterium]|nr:flippase [Candidatus Gracilibacteria bacterium]MCF7898669.1 flippase [Candidatus Paceibacterota bacterium]